jgi:hypothetical protein
MTIEGDGFGSFDPEELARCVIDARAVPGEDWSAPSTLEATGVHHGMSRQRVVSDGYRHPPAALFERVLDRFAPVRMMYVSQLDPGGFIVSHRDASPWYDRWHVPVLAAGTYTEEGRVYTPIAGEPFRVRHWVCHALSNPGPDVRVSLVIDRDVAVSRPPAPFALCLEGNDG